MPEAPIAVNNRRYALPKQPTVVVCVDGCEPDYLAQVVASGAAPWAMYSGSQPSTHTTTVDALGSW